ncbi:(2Fe-2S)-binding protein [Paenarthrobacter sp. CM16]|uniref:(2Fe-2S)-binding protein n=1 Tax=Paenarthrobacter sp. CM16 TaxID=2738447 RepID=UPI00155442ED|nr:(2Fe-2S)-binding protein [Paenarthrobacter sp. CM16]NQD86452.1 (2Fe-2S)-binding protein [Paenarthrobacter sp. CM16]
MSTFEIDTTINGTPVRHSVDARKTLAVMLRDDFQLTGTHIGCKTGNCGACTVELDGATVKSCCVMAAEVDGSEVTTIEQLSQGGELHPMQEAFSRNQALQCGFCTPGMIMSACALLKTKSEPTEEEIRVGLKGNLCRCTGYDKIIKAVQQASKDAPSGNPDVTSAAPLEATALNG